ncbi:uncharacterized protein OCT59_028047 [Rhizophagus irregularis]|nr:hypothetical protein OCT59_028047 [Rhizophagus irregularis]GBC43147.2 hypothetical protein GLOIN_2v1882501 [Rhizophagus irregularis DAOM 181602=DAOM 197198]
MIVIIKSPSYLTKWTLFQLCIAALGYSISTLPSILIYGDNLLEKAFTSNLCMIQFRVASFFFYPLNLLPIELSFYFYGLLKPKLDLNIEKKWFWTLTSITWILSLFYNSLILIITRNDENGGIIATRFYCEAYKVTNNWNHFWVYQFIVSIFLVATIISLFSIIILYRKWKIFNNNQNRRTAIKLGYAVRLFIYIIIYTALLGCYIISDIIKQLRIGNKELTNYAEDSYCFGDFTSAIAGIILLLIFGGNRTAAICLPCCYYVPPHKAYQPFVPPSFTPPQTDMFEIIVNDNNNNVNVNVNEYIENSEITLDLDFPREN